MPIITSKPGGVEIAVRVIPRARKRGIAGTREGALLVRLTAPPVEGAANAELIALLSHILKVPKSAISILSGQTGRGKRVGVSGITIEHAARALTVSGRV